MSQNIAGFFAKVDKDGDGSITVVEFLELFKTLDKDGSGTLNLEEFRAGILEEMGGTAKQAEKAFEALDTKSSGQLDVDQLKEFFHQMDKDNSGDISLTEFTEFWQGISQ